MMRFTVLTLFPEMFTPLQESILKRARDSGLIGINLINFRAYAPGKHRNVDDVPYGGGVGMVLKPEPLFAAVRDLPKPTGRRRIILLSPQGKVFRHKTAVEWSQYDELVFLCGHYEGFDERVRELADEESSLGDFVLTGGELAAMAMIDAVARLIPGVLGESLSCVEESHSDQLLEYPHYTRPMDFEGRTVPDVLLSGHHAQIARWRRKEALRRTFLRRRDLCEGMDWLAEDYFILEELAAEQPEIAVWREKWQHLQPSPKKRYKKLKKY